MAKPLMSNVPHNLKWTFDRAVERFWLFLEAWRQASENQIINNMPRGRLKLQRAGFKWVELAEIEDD